MAIKVIDANDSNRFGHRSVPIVDGTYYMNANIRSEQYDALMAKLDLILQQQAIIMDRFGMQPNGNPAHIKA